MIWNIRMLSNFNKAQHFFFFNFFSMPKLSLDWTEGLIQQKYALIAIRSAIWQQKDLV